MTNVRTLPATSATAPLSAPTAPHRHRLRAVAPHEALPSPATAPGSGSPGLRPGGPPARHGIQTVAELLEAGATWIPAPQHSLPVLPGQPPMVGYLVLVPAEQAPRTGDPEPVADPTAAATVTAATAAALAGATATLSPAPPPARTPVPAPAPGASNSDGTVRIDPERRTAQVQDRPLDLTYLEFELLAHLVAHPHRVHTRDQLVTTVWGYGHVGDGRTVDVHVARLRRKLGAAHRSSIVTVRRVGYKYVPTA
ncbi:winged helix-turn-helix domain-containing protein [Streptomyces natalensis]|uniref:Regulatory protein n=1 Tax=Streptomyces natalensis ATCC 27448 TaxID=1240678 RepID=A0A0D7CQH4_9ACTN|nr:winged helix-turn-helix domain-containing protein [Streptomyces natalensis]KIZ18120.1 regulatory protein [Streptomyces natalensis ATCC 27448]